MIDKKYLEQIKRIITAYDKGGKNKYFIFGSSVENDNFADIDIGVTGDIGHEDLAVMKGALTESTLPYKVDLIKMDDASDSFKNNVLKKKVIWLTR